MRQLAPTRGRLVFSWSSRCDRITLGIVLCLCLGASLAFGGADASARPETAGKPVSSPMLVYFLPLTSITEVLVTRDNARSELDKLVFTDHRVMESAYRYLRPTHRRGVFDPRAIRLVVEPFGKHGRVLVDTEGMIRSERGDYEMSPRDYCLLNRLLTSFRDAKEAADGPPVPVD